MPWWNAKDKKSRVPPRTGKFVSESVKRKISRSRKRRLKTDPKFRALLSRQAKHLNSPKVHKLGVVTRKKPGGWYDIGLRKRMLEDNPNQRPEVQKKISEGKIKSFKDPEVRKRHKEGIAKHWRSKGNIEKRKRYAKQMIKNVLATTRPNGSELKLKTILDRNFPGEFVINVTGKVSIGRKVPDFVHVGGKKVLVELFGTFWHTMADRVKPRSKAAAIIERRRHFWKFGYKVVVVWENELWRKYEKKIVCRIRRVL